MTYHARLSPSSAHRWTKCAGAPRLEGQVPVPPAGPHADLGTAAHELAETALCEHWTRDQLDAVDVCVISDREGGTTRVAIGQDTRDAVWMYVTIVREKAAELGIEPTLERFVSLEELNPPPGCEGGTVDTTLYDAPNKHLFIYDYKNGYTPVDAEDNEQMRTYALGVVIEDKIRPDFITTTIVQPRSADDNVKSETFTFAELIEFKKMLFAAAEAANDPDAPAGPVGSHCKWCRAKAICPAQQANAVAVVQSEFDALPPQLPEPAELAEHHMLNVLEKAGQVEDWFAAVRVYAKALLEAGHEVPGWKLVNKRVYRRWADEEAAEEWLRKRFRQEEVYSQKIVTPGQAEKLVKAKFARLTIPDEMISAESSGTNMVPESNPKPAVLISAPADEFDVQA